MSGNDEYMPVEECLKRHPNHFTLAYQVANRAHGILRRGDAQVPENEDQVVMVALREIAGGHTNILPMQLDIDGNREDKPEVADTPATISADASENASDSESKSVSENAPESKTEPA